jgi:transcription antitermination protein NusB
MIADGSGTLSARVLQEKQNMARRRRAREVAVQLLYQLDHNPDADAYLLKRKIAELIDDSDLQDFCWHLLSGVLEHRDELDEKITAAAENWTIERMAPTDRNAIRVGAFELTHENTPPRVAIDEAIELARKYGTASSSQFVNGVLDQLYSQNKTAEAAQDES